MGKIKKTAIILSAASAAYLIYKSVGDTVTRLLVSNALDREAPKIMGKFKGVIKGNKKPDPLNERIRSESDRLEALELEKVRIKAEDGTDLVGRYRPAPDAKRCIVAMHGWRTAWSRDFGAICDFLYENGCSVLYAVQRGQGESGGKHMGFGTVEGVDCAQWVKWLNRRTGGALPVYLFGVSMGATSTMMAAGMELEANVAGVIADCGFTSARDIWKHVVENNLHIRYARREKKANELCYGRLGCRADKYSTLNALARTKLPVLFIHGTKDTFVPIEMTYQNYEACRSPRTLLVVPGATHARSAWMDPDAYRAALVRFWNENDQ